MNDFWKDVIEPGYYDKIQRKGLSEKKGLQTNWHRSTFLKVSEYLKDDYLHLDYACGPGTFIGLYLDSKSIGTDISDAQINYAQANYGDKANFIKFDNFNFHNYKDNFDVITVLGLLEFIDDNKILELLDNFCDILKKDGKLVLTTPNYGGAMYLLEILLNKIGKLNYNNQHINRFNAKKLKKLIKESNFDDIEIKRYLNFGIFTSFISFKFSDKLMRIIDKVFFNFFGFLLIVELKK